MHQYHSRHDHKKVLPLALLARGCAAAALRVGVSGPESRALAAPEPNTLLPYVLFLLILSIYNVEPSPNAYFRSGVQALGASLAGRESNIYTLRSKAVHSESLAPNL